MIICTLVAPGYSSAGIRAEELSSLHTQTGSTIRVMAPDVGRGLRLALESMRGRSDVRFEARRSDKARLDLFPADVRWTLTEVFVGEVHRDPSHGDYEERGPVALELTMVVSP